IAEQARCIVFWIGRINFNGRRRLARAGSAASKPAAATNRSASSQASSAAAADAWNAVERNARPLGGQATKRQIAEKQPIAAGIRVVVKRPFDLYPLHRIARHAVLGGQRIDVLLV